ncbi:MAG: DUF177 domain-containing protein, partial [Pedobacter sp.]
MVQRLESLAVGHQEEEEQTNDDPRWEALKKLK